MNNPYEQIVELEVEKSNLRQELKRLLKKQCDYTAGYVAEQINKLDFRIQKLKLLLNLGSENGGKSLQDE